LLIYDAVYLAAVMQLQDAYEHELGGMWNKVTVLAYAWRD
jgi:hypothetical protein